MAYTPPASNAAYVDLRPVGSPPVTIPSFVAVSVDLATEDGAGGGVPPANSENARIRNFSILLAI